MNWCSPLSRAKIYGADHTNNKLRLSQECVILVSICGGDIGEVTHTPHFCKIKSTEVPECTQCTMEVTRYTATAKFRSTSELLIT